MQRIGLTVHISTKPNRSHVVHGQTSLILPTLGRTDRDDKHPGGAQFLSVEDSMSVVHSTQGRLQPVSEHLLAEPVIVARMAEAVFGDGPPRGLEGHGRGLRRGPGPHLRACCPGSRTSTPGSGPRTASCCPTRRGTPGPSRPTSAAAGFTVSPLEYLTPPDGHLILQTIRSHDQYNTTFYGLDDRYRGISDGRRVILVHPEDLAELGFAGPGPGGRGLHLPRARTAGRQVPAGGLPDGEGLRRGVLPRSQRAGPPENVARESNTPGFKAMFVRFVPHAAEPESGEESASLAAATAG